MEHEEAAKIIDASVSALIAGKRGAWIIPAQYNHLGGGAATGSEQSGQTQEPTDMTCTTHPMDLSAQAAAAKGAEPADAQEKKTKGTKETMTTTQWRNEQRRRAKNKRKAEGETTMTTEMKTKRGSKGNRPEQKKRRRQRRRQRQAEDLHALREKDPVAAARADAAATKAGREARLKADAHAAIAVGDLAAAAKCISQLEKLKKQKKKKKKTQKKDATAAGRTETLVGSAPSADAACAAGDTTGRQRLAALVTRMSNAPCPKGGSAIASVRVHKPTMMSREPQRYRVRVTAKTRRKPKSKEKRGQMRLLASETRHVLQGGAGAATEAAVRSAVHMLEAIDAGRIALRSVNAKMVRGY